MECCLRTEAGTAGEEENSEVGKGSGMWVLDSQRGLFFGVQGSAAVCVPVKMESAVCVPAVVDLYPP